MAEEKPSFIKNSLAGTFAGVVQVLVYARRPAQPVRTSNLPVLTVFASP